MSHFRGKTATNCVITFRVMLKVARTTKETDGMFPSKTAKNVDGINPSCKLCEVVKTPRNFQDRIIHVFVTHVKLTIEPNRYHCLFTEGVDTS